ncbi:unnamed protein product [Pedinophyceae sp. YPF-701]|nr:unnamed protein product [Pedinophyceae sp. YPF-701]
MMRPCILLLSICLMLVLPLSGASMRHGRGLADDGALVDVGLDVTQKTTPARANDLSPFQPVETSSPPETTKPRPSAATARPIIATAAPITAAPPETRPPETQAPRSFSLTVKFETAVTLSSRQQLLAGDTVVEKADPPSTVSTSAIVRAARRAHRRLQQQTAAYDMTVTFTAPNEATAALAEQRATANVVTNPVAVGNALTAALLVETRVQLVSLTPSDGTEPDTGSEPSPSSGSSSAYIVIGAAVAGGAAGLVLIAFFAYYAVVRRRRAAPQPTAPGIGLSPDYALSPSAPDPGSSNGGTGATAPNSTRAYYGTARENMWASLKHEDLYTPLMLSGAEVESIIAKREVVGEGAFGTVYKGFWRGRHVAVKRLAGFPGYRRECEALTRLRHPHIVPILAQSDDACAIVSPFYQRGSMRRMLQESATTAFPWQMRVRMLHEVALAVLSMHSDRDREPVIHRDLKPDNVLCTNDGSAVVADLGCAKVTDSSIVTGPKGTFGYTDPAYIQRPVCRPDDAHLDVYSMGVIALELLFNKGGPVVGGRHVRDVALAAFRDADANAALAALCDGTAGDWPTSVISRLVSLGIACTDPGRQQRPSMATFAAEMRSLHDLSGTSSLRQRWQQQSLTSVDAVVREFEESLKRFICPITTAIPRDPVRAGDGMVYERDAIERWFKQQKRQRRQQGHGVQYTSPMTRERIGCAVEACPDLHRAVREEVAVYRARISDPEGLRRLDEVMEMYSE